MTRAAMRYAMKVLAALMAGFVLLAAVAIWQLSKGPVSLGILTPYIDEALNPPGSNVRVDLGDPSIMWAGWERAIDIVAPNVTISTEGSLLPIARFSSVSVGFSLESALKGEVRLTSLDLFNPTLRLLRTQDGSVVLRMDSKASGEADANGEVSDAPTSAALPLAGLSFLRGPTESSRPLGLLERVSVIDGTVILDDQAAQRFWRVSDVFLDLRRTNEDLFLTINGHSNIDANTTSIAATASLPHDGNHVDTVLSLDSVPMSLMRIIDPMFSEIAADITASVSVNANLDLDRIRHDIDAELLSELGNLRFSATIAEPENALILQGSVGGLRPSSLAETIPDLAAAEGIDIPLQATFSAAGSLDGVLENASVVLQSGPGQITLPDFFVEPVPVSQGAATIAFLNNGNSIKLEQLSIDLDGPKVIATGMIENNGLSASEVTQRIEFDGLLVDMQLSRLDGLWPRSLAVPARDWVVGNMPEANAHQARIGFRGSMVGMNPDTLSIDDLGGEIEFDGAIVHYLRPMPPATQTSGFATYDTDSFLIENVTGKVGEINVTAGTIDIKGLSGDTENIDITIDVDTPIPDALTLLNIDPFRLVDDLGIDPGGINGTGTVVASFKFPLSKKLQASDVNFSAEAALNNVTMKEAATGIFVESESLDLQVNNNGIAVLGAARLDGLPATINWEERFSTNVDFPRRLVVSGHVPIDYIAKYGLNLGEWLEGSAFAQLTYSAARGGAQLFDAEIDLEKLTMSAPEFGFSKQFDEAGKANFKIELPTTGNAEISEFSVETDTLKTHGSARFSEGFGSFLELIAEEFRHGSDALRFRISRLPEDGFRIDAIGSSLDVGRLLEKFEEEDTEEPPEGDPNPPISVFADVKRLTAGDVRRLDNVRMELHYDGLYVDTLQLTADLENGDPLSISYLPAEGGRHDLNVTSSDAGRTMKALDWTDRIDGGVLTLTGVRPTPDAPLEGQLLVEDFKLTNAPALAKVLEFMSLTGILSALGESGLDFDRMEGRFSYRDGELTITEGRTYGSSLGITAKGKMSATDVELDGTVATMYTISRLFENIPILNIIVGGKEGLFGANFSVSGAPQDPDVKVNPLSALAPGFVRTLFNQLPVADPDSGLAPPPTTSASDR